MDCDQGTAKVTRGVSDLKVPAVKATDGAAKCKPQAGTFGARREKWVEYTAAKSGGNAGASVVYFKGELALFG